MMTQNMHGAVSHCPLAGFPIAQTTEVEEAESLLARFLGGRTRVAAASDPRRFRFEINAVRLGRITLSSNFFGADTIAGPGMLEDGVIFGIGHRGRSIAKLDSTVIVSTNRAAAMISPGQKVLMERPQNSSIIALRVSHSVLAERFRELTGHEPNGPFAFERAVDASRAGGAAAVNALKFVVAELERDPASLDRRIFCTGVEDMLLAALLGLPNRHSAELVQGYNADAPPRAVRLAEAYLEAHAGDAISVSDLVRICNCSQSALYQAFHKSRGYSPMQFLAEIRLQNAHRSLLSGTGYTVGAAALEAGFNHLGRFAEAYRKRFGETPSQTLGYRKSRRIYSDTPAS